MKKDDWKLIGICGIYCGDCPSYLANQTNDFGELETRAQRRNGKGVALTAGKDCIGTPALARTEAPASKNADKSTNCYYAIYPIRDVIEKL
jgi:hypothetical protein